jgi:hypothetical protein
MTVCVDRMPAPKYVMEEQEDMRSSTIANVGINGEDKVVKECATVLSTASTTISYWSNLNTCSRTAGETRVLGMIHLLSQIVLDGARCGQAMRDGAGGSTHYLLQKDEHL